MRRTIEEHGGRVWVESEGEGCGSCFSMALPVASLGNQLADGGQPLQPN